MSKYIADFNMNRQGVHTDRHGILPGENMDVSLIHYITFSPFMKATKEWTGDTIFIYLAL